MSARGFRRRRASGLVRTYALLILAVTGLTVFAALHTTSSSPSYQSTAQVSLSSTVSRSGSYLAPAMPTEQQVAESGLVGRRAGAVMGVSATRAMKNLDVAVPTDADVLTMTYTADTAQAAYEGARAFSEVYARYRNVGHPTPIASIITPANVPPGPVASNMVLVVGVAVLAGLAIGCGAAWVWDRTADRLRTIADVEKHTGLPVLEALPRFPSVRAGRGLQTPAEVAAAFDTITGRIPALVEARHGQTLLVTGATRGAGASTVALHVAASLARMGKQVVLVVAPPQGSVVAGLGELADESEVPEAVVHHSSVPGLRTVQPTPSRERAARHAGVTLDDLQLLVWRLAGDALVVIDGPAVLGADRAGLLAYVSDHVLLVVDSAHGLRSSAQEATAALAHVHDKLVGCVTNRPRRSSRRLPWRLVRSGPVVPSDVSGSGVPDPVEPSPSAPADAGPVEARPDLAAGER